MARKFVDKKSAKSEEYTNVLKKIIAHGRCPFCFKNFKNFSFSKHKPLKTTRGWFVVRSSWPYKNARFHFLIIPKRHFENPSYFNKKDFFEVSRLTRFLIKKFAIKGGGLTFRFGSPKLTGATVLHFHFHLIVPKTNKKGNALPVAFPIG